MISSIDAEEASDKVHYPFITPGYFFIRIFYHCFFSLTLFQQYCSNKYTQSMYTSQHFPSDRPFFHQHSVASPYTTYYSTGLCSNVTSIYKKVAFITCYSLLMFHFLHTTFHCCCCSVTQSCPTLCDHMDCSTSGFSVFHKLLELTQLMPIELVMPSNLLILCHPLLLLLSIFSSIRVFSNASALCIRWPKY